MKRNLKNTLTYSKDAGKVKLGNSRKKITYWLKELFFTIMVVLFLISIVLILMLPGCMIGVIVIILTYQIQ